MKTFYTLFSLFFVLSTSLFSAYSQCPASAKINEFHYDNGGTDVNEFVEISLPTGSDPTQIQVDLYNGSNGTVYATIILSSTEFVSTDGTIDYYVWNVSVQNGADGIATTCIDGTQYQFITYEGAFMATDGPYAGAMGIDIGVVESSATTESQSIMCDGSSTFSTNCTADPGAANDLTSCGNTDIMGCTDVNACNYNMNATTDDGSCFIIGDTCDDSNANTTGDVYTDCNTCAGTCSLGNTGDACDDGDANTNNDMVTAACECQGTLIGGGTCPASAKINEFHYDNAGTDLNEFIEIALPADSDPTQVQVDLYNGSNGTVYSTIILSSAEFVSTDGSFDYYVWNASPQNGPDGIATSCIDGTQYQFITYEGAFTANDGPFSGQMGTDIGVEETSATTETQSIMCDGSGTFSTNCTADPGAANNLSSCGSTEIMGCTDLNACNYNMNATTDDGSCFNINDACDDGNANTTGDIYTDCNTCAGTCSLGNTGDACDDGDANTGNDMVTATCECQGTLIGGGTCPASAKINEFHYDNAGTDLNEFIEIALPADSDPTQVQVDLYNGSNGTVYSTIILSSVEFVSTDGSSDYYVWNVSPQNGADGIATSCIDGTQYQFITYEGTFTATDGPFMGADGTDVGVEETSATTETQSIMCDGSGTFSTNCTADPGAANDLSSCGSTDIMGCTDVNACNYNMNATTDDGSCFNINDTCDDGNANTTGDVYTDCNTCAGTCSLGNTGDACDDGDANTNNDMVTAACECQGTLIGGGTCPASAKINEFHYDNAGTDLNEFIEIALPAGSDPTQVQVDLYNGSNGTVYSTIILSGAEFVSTDGSFDYYVWNASPQNGPDGIATSCIDGTQYQFITYEGPFMATDGPFTGVDGTDIGVEETSATTETQSIMCDGSGTFLTNCTADPGAANDLTSCGSTDIMGCTDVNACNYNMNATTDDGSCFNINDTCDDGNANTTGDVYIDCNTCAGTCSLGNTGDACDDGDANTGNDMVTATCECQGTIIGGGTCPVSAKINEFHYDNAGTDLNEFIEIALPAGSDPTQVQVDLYNGSNGTVYSTIILSSAEFVSTDGSFDYYVWNASPQNGPDGIATSCIDGTQYQFITYEGTFTATDGPFMGVDGTDVGVEETSATTETQSIMCDGSGTFLTNCAADPGVANNLATCGAISGCTDANACNYNMEATVDDDSCFSINDACDDGNANTSGDVYIDCDTCIGTCSLGNTGDSCDDGDSNTENDMVTADCTCVGTPIGGGDCPASAKINEFHYDNGGTDINEFVEIALPAGSDPTQIQVDLYNGNNGTSYSSIILSSAEFVSSDGTFDYYVWNVAPQNGPDGIAVSCIDGTQYQFITYEGAFMATDGPFAGVDGIDVGVSEDSGTGENQSIMCDGTGTFFTNCTADAGAANDLNTCVTDLEGCTDEMACNYNPGANVNDGTCLFAEGCDVCDGMGGVIDNPDVGELCDDGDPNTNYDSIQADCTCQGTTESFDCPNLLANVGEACDDDNPSTEGDTIQEDCTCNGTPVCLADFVVGEVTCETVTSGTDSYSVDISFTGGGNDMFTIVPNAGEISGLDCRCEGLAPVPPGDLVISELSFNPCAVQGGDSSCEYFVITNNGNSALDLSAYAINNAFTFIFPGGTTINTGESLSVGISNNCAVANFDIAGGWSGSMSNGTNETLDIVDATGTIIGSFTYSGSLGDGNCLAQCFDNTATPTECESSVFTDPVFDCPALMLNFGANCDDMDDTTTSDMVQTDCTCAGTSIFNCPGLMGNFGDNCDDGDATTGNDIIQFDCTCAGTPYDCPDIPAYAGTFCDDGDPTTGLDIIQADCTCAGLAYDCPDLLNYFGFPCEDGDPTTGNETVQTDCTCVGITYDCVAEQAFFGDFCLDSNGDESTFGQDCACIETNINIGDIIITELSYNPCATQGADGDCEYIIIQNNGTVDYDLTGWSFGNALSYSFPTGTMLAVGASLSIGTSNNCASATFDLSGWTGGLGNSGETIVILDGSGFVISTYEYDNSFANGDCMAYCIDELGIASSCESSVYGPPLYDCPELMAFVGNSCDDNNEMTVMDEIQTDCTCVGIIPTFDCPDEMVDLGDDCDDGDVNTTGDIIILGGDNPDFDNAGMITVTAIPEGTDLVFTITSTNGCSFDINVPSPVCDPEPTDCEPNSGNFPWNGQ